MTVKMLVDWKDPSTGRQYRIGNLLDTDDYTEAGLIASKQAQADLTGGTAQTDPTVNHGDGPVVRTNPAGTALVVGGNEVPIGELAALDGISRYRTGLEGRSAGTHNSTSIKKQVLRRFVSLVGVTASNSATLSLEEIDGVLALKVVTQPNTSTDVGIDFADLAGPLHDTLVWLVRTPDPTKVASYRMLSSQGNYSGWWDQTNSMNVASNNYLNRNSWVALESSRLNGISSGAGFNWDSSTLDKCKIRITPASGETATVYIHSCYLVVKDTPNIIIGFDDQRPACSRAGSGGAATLRGVAGTYTHKEILDAYGYKGSLFLVTKYIENDALNAYVGGSLTWAELAALKAAGWDIQTQCHSNAGGSDSVTGTRLLGPAGYATRGIASVNTGTDEFTSSATHYIFQGIFGYPIEFVGTDLPTGISTGTTYWARGTAATTFKIFNSELDSLANTNAINMVDAGTPANYGYRYYGSANDSSAIQADIAITKALIKQRLGHDSRHIAYNHGAEDSYVWEAARAEGMVSSRSTALVTYHANSVADREIAELIAPLRNMYVVQIDEATARDVSYYTGLITTAISTGCNVCTYAHSSNATTAQNLANFCEAAYLAEVAGTVHVCTVSEAYKDFI